VEQEDLLRVGATLCAHVGASGALASSALTEVGVVTATSEGELTLEVADGAARLDAAGAEPYPLGLELRRLPPFEADEVHGEVSGAIGALEHAAEGSLALAVALGGRRVAFVQFPTLDDQTPFAISARMGEPLVLVIGGEQYEMAEGWPRRSPPGA